MYDGSSSSQKIGDTESLYSDIECLLIFNLHIRVGSPNRFYLFLPVHDLLNFEY